MLINIISLFHLYRLHFKIFLTDYTLQNSWGITLGNYFLNSNFKFASLTSSTKSGSGLTVTEIHNHYLKKKKIPNDSSKYLPDLEIRFHICTVYPDLILGGAKYYLHV